jgi:hypothetical protein
VPIVLCALSESEFFAESDAEKILEFASLLELATERESLRLAFLFELESFEFVIFKYT